MAQRFESLEKCLEFISQLEAFGMEVPEQVLAEKERLENINQEEYIFGTMAAHNKFMTQQKEKVVREMTEQLLIDGPKATQPCLLLGKVQCGKTDTFESIIGLCFDKGIDMAVVMTKGTRTLTNQTLQRMNHDFRFFKDNGSYGQKAIVEIYDVLPLYHRGGLSISQLQDPIRKFIIVVKKETTNIQYLNELFRDSEMMRMKKVLVCDDEADFSSHTFKKEKGEMDLLEIPKLIEELIKLPNYCRYLQVTATPYSLFLQPDGTVKLRDGKEASQWLPRYTGLVPIHERYIGGKQYFEQSEDEDSMYSCLYQPVTKECNSILSVRNPWFQEQAAHRENLRSLNLAIVGYLFATAVRSIQVRKSENRKYKSSCLIHCETAKAHHKWQEDLIVTIIEEIKHAFLERGNSDLHILDLESEVYASLRHSNELGQKEGLIKEVFPSFAEVEAEAKHILQFNEYVVKVVNSEEPVATMLNEKGQLRLDNTLNFFIGGSILDRGITIDNMLCFFYGRDPKKFQMDTVLQHARMYGARDKEDMACTRFFTTEAIYDVLKTINEIDAMMYEYLKAHRTSAQTNDFTSMVIGYDSRINATSQSKYLPANTTVIRPKKSIFPMAFQTGDNGEIADVIKEIDSLIASCPGYKKRTDEEPFFLMEYDTAVKIIKLISSTFRYSDEWENMDYLWDDNEMRTTLDHCVFGSDGMIYCLVRTNRNMSREREKQSDGKRWSDAPYDGHNDLRPARVIAQDRPVLMLLRQNGKKEQGWRDTPFYWPVFVVQENVSQAIFTINANKKIEKKKTRPQFRLESFNQYPKEEILQLTIHAGPFFDFLAGIRNNESRVLKSTNCSLFLERDENGKYVLADYVDHSKYYDLSSYNNGVFPFVTRKYKYLYLRNSQDFSGSQMFIKLNEKPFNLCPEQGKQTDIIYSEKNIASDAEDDDICEWTIDIMFDKILEYKLTPNDQKAFEEYQAYLEWERGHPQDEEEDND